MSTDYLDDLQSELASLHLGLLQPEPVGIVVFIKLVVGLFCLCQLRRCILARSVPQRHTHQPA